MVMSLRQLAVAILVVCGGVAGARAAGLPTYSAVVVFGDSYCDVGNVYAARKGAVPPVPYYQGRFSNGPLWVEHVASSLGLPLVPSLVGGTDYAFGGAKATESVTTAYGVIPSVTEQVALYLSQHGGKADPNALYVIEGGGNDILGATTSDTPQDLGFKIAIALTESELMLRQAGARKFVIPDLADVGALPAAQGVAAFATAATVAVNTRLTQLLGYEAGIKGLEIARVDTFALFRGVVRDTSHFGFTNVMTPCLMSLTLCSDPAHTLFWDAEHPTVFGHALLAAAAEVQLPK